MKAELERCAAELTAWHEWNEQHAAPAWLTALGEMDWRIEAQLIQEGFPCC